MKRVEECLEDYCSDFTDAEIDYCHNKNDSPHLSFYYDMDDQYDNEMLVIFPINSTQIVEFLNGLEDSFRSVIAHMYWTENWGEESGCEYDRVWIWW